MNRVALGVLLCFAAARGKPVPIVIDTDIGAWSLLVCRSLEMRKFTQARISSSRSPLLVHNRHRDGRYMGNFVRDSKI